MSDHRDAETLCSVVRVSDLRSQEQGLPSFDESWSRALCVVAHPDDLEYGMAAAVDRWVQQGKTISYLLVTHGEAGIDAVAPSEAASLRAQEERDGASEVGVEVVEFLDYDDGMVEYNLPLRRDIARTIRIQKPEVVITLTHRERFAGGGTNQADHRAVVGLVGASAREPLAMGERDDHLGLLDADRASDVATQRKVVLDHAVVVVEELHDLDAHLGCAVAFLLGTQRRRFAGGNCVDAGLAVGDEQIADGLALLDPAVNRRGHAVLEIIGVRNHAKRP